MTRVYNFSAGPACLPEWVLKKAASEMLDAHNSGMSVMEMSHRSSEFQDIIDTCKARLKRLMNIPDEYEILFLQGGASLQFTMIPLNLEKHNVDLINTGQWTKKDLKEYVRKVMENQAKNSKSQATINEVENYMIENSTVDIPEDYMDARMGEYQAMFERDNLTDTQTMDDYLKKNNTTLDDLKKSWKTSLEKQIKVEFIFERIADLEDIQVTDDDFKQFVDYLASSGNSQMTTESEVYDYYGNGNQEGGKKMLRQQYRINKAISYVVKQANVTVEPATESTEN